MPAGRGALNEEGIAFYSPLIDCLLENGIEPWVTLYHWDLPLALHKEADGLLNPDFPTFFGDYADVCFGRFGDRVKHWITFNEPWCSSVLGYGRGEMAPGRISADEPYLVGHNLLRAHGETVDRYRCKFQDRQKGIIGISNNCDWREPLSNSSEDVEAAQRSLEYFLGWFADPIYFGDYPESMRAGLGERLPRFSDRDRELLIGSTDFFGLNHYTTMLAAADGSLNGSSPQGNGGIFEDQKVFLTDDPRWEKTHMGWSIVPWGYRKLLNWISDRYDRPPIYITENGCAMTGEDD